jgi:hypothetical protein
MVIAAAQPGRHAGQARRLACRTGTEFTGQLLDALRRFAQGDAEPYKSLWSRTDDVTIFGGWGAYEQGWAAVEPRLEWAASRYSEGWLDRETCLKAWTRPSRTRSTLSAAEGDSITPPRSARRRCG